MDGKEKSNIMPFIASTEKVQKLSQEEIDYVMEQDEKFINKKLELLSTFNSVADSSGVEEEEDDEEEVFTLDLENHTAYQKVAEGVACRTGDGEVTMINDEALSEKIKSLVQEEKNKNEVRYENLIRDRFVSKAIADLIERLKEASDDTYEVIKENIGTSTSIANQIGEEAVAAVDKKKKELRDAYVYGGYGKIDYSRIPEWALPYIDEYIEDAINALILSIKRD